MTEQPGQAKPKQHLTIRQAAFIGVGAMVGAGIFALLGAAGEVAGSAVWLSFLIAGAVAGAAGLLVREVRRPIPSAGGLLEYVAKGFGEGHFTGDHRLAHLRRQRDHHRHGGRVLRQLRQRAVRPRRRGLDQGVRRPHPPGHDRRSTSSAPSWSQEHRR